MGQKSGNLPTFSSDKDIRTTGLLRLPVRTPVPFLINQPAHDQLTTGRPGNNTTGLSGTCDAHSLETDL